MNTSRSLLLGFLLATLIACDRQPENAATPAPVKSEKPLAVPTAKELANLRYPSVEAPEGSVLLKDGEYSNDAAKVAVNLVEDFTRFGDLTGDGQADALVLLITTTGASGIVYDIAVVAREASGQLNVRATKNLGERIDLKKLEIRADKIHADYITQGPDDPQCCPTVPVTAVFNYETGNLVEVKK